jgi:hypothetical protein
MRIGIVGSRKRNSLRDQRQVMDLVGRLTADGGEHTLVSGGALRGADSFAEAAGRVHGVPMAIHRPNHSEGHRFPAEPYFLRNLRIAEDSDAIYAWIHEDRHGGTENTIRHALALGKPVHLVTDDGRVYLSQDGRIPDCQPLMRLRG